MCTNVYGFSSTRASLNSWYEAKEVMEAKEVVEAPGIDPGTSRMLSERSTI